MKPIKECRGLKKKKVEVGKAIKLAIAGFINGFEDNLVRSIPVNIVGNRENKFFIGSKENLKRDGIFNMQTKAENTKGILMIGFIFVQSVMRNMMVGDSKKGIPHGTRKLKI